MRYVQIYKEFAKIQDWLRSLIIEHFCKSFEVTALLKFCLSSTPNQAAANSPSGQLLVEHAVRIRRDVS